MHNAALKFCNLDGSYDLVDLAPANLRDGIENLIASGFVGFNVTIPHKDAVYRMAVEYTKRAQQAQASNTVKVLSDRSLLADNTDIDGFKETLADSDVLKMQHAAILGTGGAAKAATIALAESGFKSITVISRDIDRAQSFLKSVDAGTAASSSLKASSIEEWSTLSIELLVNCSPVGLNGASLPEWIEQLLAALSKQAFIYDMVYSRSAALTPLVRAATAQGIATVDGTEMLIRQAHKAFQFWDRPLAAYRCNAPGVAPPIALNKRCLTFEEYRHELHR